MAIAIGMWPSVLTFGALIALPLALIALAGVIRPVWVLGFRALRRFAAVGGALLLAEVGLLFVVLVWTRRRPVELVARQPVPPLVRIVYGVADGAPRRWLHWTRRFDVPASGIVYSRYAADGGSYDSADPHPLTITIQDGAGERRGVRGSWIGGGSAPAGQCTVEYDDFALVPVVTPREPSVTEVGPTSAVPLDSLETWGLGCRSGKLLRATKGTSPALHRSGPACYYDRSGNMACEIKMPAP